jgi:hypothetical protein
MTTNLKQVNDVADMVEMLQQQAGMLQAFEAVKQGQEAARQGVSILLFTVFSIIFVRQILLLASVAG